MTLKEKVSRRRVRAQETGELKDKTVYVNRVAKVVKGGKRFSFTALVVSGDGRGNVGVGLGKAGEVPDAIRKASGRARKGIFRVPLRGSTVPHDVIGRFGPTTVVMKPASPGTGVIAGSAARSLIEVSGIKDIKAKIIGSTNPYNVIYATIQGLLQLRDPEGIASSRGVQLAELGYQG